MRISRWLPIAQTRKMERQLRSERWECAVPVWFGPGRADSPRPLRPEDREALRAAFVVRGREPLLV